jgi:hypothetical protein
MDLCDDTAIGMVERDAMEFLKVAERRLSPDYLKYEEQQSDGCGLIVCILHGGVW